MMLLNRLKSWKTWLVIVIAIVIVSGGAMLTFALTQPLKIDKFSVSSDSLYVHETIELKTEAHGGNDIQYQYSCVNNGQTTILKDYSSEHVLQYTPETSGEWTFIVNVKSGEDTVSKSINIEVYDLLDGELQIDNLYVNEKVKLQMFSIGGSGDTQYEVKYDFDNQSQILQEYSTNQSMDLTVKQEGQYVFHLALKDSKGTVVTKDYPVEIKKRDMKVQLSSTGNYVQEPISLKTSIKGGTGDKLITYSYELNGKKTVLKKDTKETKLSFVPQELGKYVFSISVKDINETIREDKCVINVVNRPDIQVSSFQSNITGSTKLEKTKLTVQTKYGKGTILYQFFYTHNDNTVIIQDYSQKNTATFTPKVFGEYTYGVNVKDSRNKVTTATKNIRYQEIIIDNSQINVTVGRTKKIPYNCNVPGATLTFESSNTAVCAVDYDEGLLCPISPGKVTITEHASYDGIKVDTTFVVSVADDPSVMVGCDISAWQRKIDGASLRSTGIDFAILRAGHTTVDTYFINNVNECTRNGIQYGVYWYLTSSTPEGAIQEANNLISALNSAGIRPHSGLFTFPIYLDLENNSVGTNSEQVVTNAKAFVDTLLQNGFSVNDIGIYANMSWFQGRLDHIYFNQFRNNIWFARWHIEGRRPTFYWDCIRSRVSPSMWQVGSGFRGIVGVSSTRLDLNYYYK